AALGLAEHVEAVGLRRRFLEHVVDGPAVEVGGEEAPHPVAGGEAEEDHRDGDGVEPPRLSVARHQPAAASGTASTGCGLSPRAVAQRKQMAPSAICSSVEMPAVASV